jgi:hypothetical protein
MIGERGRYLLRLLKERPGFLKPEYDEQSGLAVSKFAAGCDFPQSAGRVCTCSLDTVRPGA